MVKSMLNFCLNQNLKNVIHIVELSILLYIYFYRYDLKIKNTEKEKKKTFGKIYNM